jgi:hypothetical protein
MAKVGRPSAMTDQVIAKLEEAWMLGCSDLEACYFADISKDALYDYQKLNPEFTERKERFKKHPTLIARRTVVRQINSDGDLALKYLERKERDEFSTKSELNTNLTFTQMPGIQIEAKDEAGKNKKVKLEFNIGG